MAGLTAGGLNAGIQTGFDPGATATGALQGAAIGAAGGLAFGVTAGGIAAFLPGGVATGAVAFGVGGVASDITSQFVGIGLGVQDIYDPRRTVFAGAVSAVGGGFLGRADRSLLGLAQRGPALGKFVTAYRSKFGTREINIIRGGIFEDVVGDFLSASAFRNIQRQVTIRPLTARGALAKRSFRGDFLADDPATLLPSVVEAKSSYSASLTRPNQSRGFQVFGRNGGIVRGNGGGRAFPNGTQLPASPVRVIRPQNLPLAYRIQFGQSLNQALTRFHFQYLVTRSYVPGLVAGSSAAPILTQE